MRKQATGKTRTSLVSIPANHRKVYTYTHLYPARVTRTLLPLMLLFVTYLQDQQPLWKTLKIVKC
jgi:hypothetical protein